MAASGMPYQCSIATSSHRAMSSRTSVSSTPMWCAIAQSQFGLGLRPGRRLQGCKRSIPNDLDTIRRPAALMRATAGDAPASGVAPAARACRGRCAARSTFTRFALVRAARTALAAIAAEVADGRDAAREPQVELVLVRQRVATALVLQVPVQVDQSWHQVTSLALDDRVEVVGARGASADARDGVAGDDHARRAAHGRPVAVDHMHVPNEQALVALPVLGSVLADRERGEESDGDQSSKHAR